MYQKKNIYNTRCSKTEYFDGSVSVIVKNSFSLVPVDTLVFCAN